MMPAGPSRTSRTAELALFLAVLIAFVAESQTAQYLQTTLGYQQPYLLFYLVHSSILLSFPIHLIYVLLKTKCGLRPLLAGLKLALAAQVASWNRGSSSSTTALPVVKMILLVVFITSFYNLLSLLWFTAVALAPVTDVTAIWNANAFFAYLFSVKLLGVKSGTLRLSAVIVATLGVLVVVYGGTATISPHSQLIEANLSNTPAPFVGDMLTLVASLLYGLYQVLYKIYIALPSEPEPPATSGHYSQLPGDVDDSIDEETLDAHDIIYPPPFGLHPNLITTMIGLCTLLVFWIPIPFLHYSRIEVFKLPPDASTLMAIAGIAVSGVVFNAGFMILLGVWGPIVASVGNLLTIVLTLFSDLSFGTVALTPWGLSGAGMIVCAFGMLVYDMF